MSEATFQPVLGTECRSGGMSTNRLGDEWWHAGAVHVWGSNFQLHVPVLHVLTNLSLKARIFNRTSSIQLACCTSI